LACCVRSWCANPISFFLLCLPPPPLYPHLHTKADVVIGPHGAGLFNAPLFAKNGTVVISFGLIPEHGSKEDNLIATCKATGIKCVCDSDKKLNNYPSTILLFQFFFKLRDRDIEMCVCVCVFFALSLSPLVIIPHICVLWYSFKQQQST
jgi:hypothetical protein